MSVRAVMAWNLQMKDNFDHPEINQVCTHYAKENQVDAILLNELGTSQRNSHAKRIQSLADVLNQETGVRWYFAAVEAGDNREFYGLLSRAKIRNATSVRITSQHDQGTRSGGQAQGSFGRRGIGVFELDQPTTRLKYLVGYHAVPDNEKSFAGLVNMLNSVSDDCLIAGDFNIDASDSQIQEVISRANNFATFKRPSQDTHRGGRLDFAIKVGRFRLTDCHRLCHYDESPTDHSPILVKVSE